jgi:hypothetical protein
MKDMQEHLERVRQNADDCQHISDKATDTAKRELFARLAAHHRILAAEVERALKQLSDQAKR